ncbi:MAG: hypothetical protein SF002_18805 [Alphaproteobacteria bacterium]|nr:hypothetical protein [Alphaproteobacteria bacterium]
MPSSALPQQKLLLELIVLSGDIGITRDLTGTVLGRTLEECRAAGWIELQQVNPNLRAASITRAGRALVSLK